MSDFIPENFHVCWSDKLEALARKLYENRDAELRDDPDPFRRTCVVFSNSARADWLRDWFLYTPRGEGCPQVLANVDQQMIYKFVNDWLYAANCGGDAKRRDPAGHPYSTDVMHWRIYGILADDAARPESEYPALSAYIGAGGTAPDTESDQADERRFALAGQIAAIFDSYQRYRPEMLKKWQEASGEKSLAGDESIQWQARLWKRLVKDAPDTYVQYFCDLDKTDLAKAIGEGEFRMPRYPAVHVFGISFMPLAYFEFFKRLTSVCPVHIYLFNPNRNDWFDDSMKAARRAVRSDIKAGAIPPGADFESLTGKYVHPLLGSLGSCGQGLICDIVDSEGVDYAWIGEESGLAQSPGNEPDSLLHRLQRDIREHGEPERKPLPLTADETLPDASIEIHDSFLPRRELEAARDTILRFIKRRKGDGESIHPRDIVVYLADWSSYSPLVDSVFGANDIPNGAIPYRLASRAGSEAPPVVASFLSILDFATNRFEASKVLGLLSIPAIASKFGIAQEDIYTVRGLIKQANIHWGYDDGHINRILAKPAGASGGEPYPFSWRRGLDRLLLNGLAGKLLDSRGREGALRAGALGELIPAGDIEGDRARLAGNLSRLVARLGRIASDFREPRSADAWRDELTRIVGEFYREDDGNSREIQSLSRTIHQLAQSAIAAESIAGNSPAGPRTIPFAAIRNALENSIGGANAATSARGDRIIFAPLKVDVIAPHKLVVICGLNDGAFPRIEHRKAFDLLGRVKDATEKAEKRKFQLMTPFGEPATRDQDAYALLEAIFAAREKLVLSYAGRDMHTKAEIPPSVLLTQVLRHLSSAFSGDGKHPPCPAVLHRLQAFNAEYFTPGASMPQSFAASAFAAARNIAAQKATRERPEPRTAGGIRVFDPDPETGIYNIDLDDLVSFFKDPPRFIAQRKMKACFPDYADYGAEDDDPLEASIGNLGQDALIMDPDRNSPHAQGKEDALKYHSRAMLEKGAAPSIESARCELEDYWGNGELDPRKRVFSINGGKIETGGASVFDALQSCTRSHRVEAAISTGKGDVRITGTLQLHSLKTDGGANVDFLILRSLYASGTRKLDAEMWLKHLVGHCSAGDDGAGMRFASGAVSVKAEGGARRLVTQFMPPLSKQRAMELIAPVLEIAIDPAAFAVPFLPRQTDAIAGIAPEDEDVIGKARGFIQEMYSPDKENPDRKDEATLEIFGGGFHFGNDIVESTRLRAGQFWGNGEKSNLLQEGKQP